MPQLDGFFLDFYGTLAGGDRAAVVAICQCVIDDYRLEAVTADELATRWGHRYFEAIETTNGHNFRLLRDIEHETLIETVLAAGRSMDDRKYIRMLCDYASAPALFEEVHEVLAALTVPVCIVSNADETELRAALQYHQLPINYVVTSESARSYKPEPAIFRAALELTGWSPERVIHVGDSLHSDVGGARRAGLRTAWVNRAERMSDIGTDTPDFIWHDLRPMLTFCPNGRSIQ